MSYHFGCARAYAMRTRVVFFLTRSKLRKPLREVLTQPSASEGFAYAKLRYDKALTKIVKGGFQNGSIGSKSLNEMDRE